MVKRRLIKSKCVISLRASIIVVVVVTIVVSVVVAKIVASVGVVESVAVKVLFNFLEFGYKINQKQYFYPILGVSIKMYLLPGF